MSYNSVETYRCMSSLICLYMYIPFLIKNTNELYNVLNVGGILQTVFSKFQLIVLSVDQTKKKKKKKTSITCLGGN